MEKEKLDISEDLEFIFKKYIQATKNGKPNLRAYKILKLALEAHEVYLHCKDGE